jgi:glyceraldehyde-3-phosphate dehydrogenase/erythrose-4-phosphate dehydrogenase
MAPAGDRLTPTAPAGDRLTPTRQLGLVIPELEGRLHGSPYRCRCRPVAGRPDLRAERASSVQEINKAFAQAADRGALTGIPSSTSRTRSCPRRLVDLARRVLAPVPPPA